MQKLLLRCKGPKDLDGKIDLLSKRKHLRIPRSIVSTATTLNTSPFICGFQDKVTSWMSSLINQQDGCLQWLPGRRRKVESNQEQLAQSVAHRAAMRTQNDQVQYLRALLAHRDAQFEHVCSERDTHFVQEEEEEVLAHMRLLSCEAKDWKSSGKRSGTSTMSRIRRSWSSRC